MNFLIPVLLLISALMNSCLASVSLDFGNKLGNNLSYIFSTEAGRQQVRDFLQNVLRQYDPEQFVSFTGDIAKTKPFACNEEIYTLLQNKVSKTRPWTTFLSKLSALKHQQKVISEQIHELITSDSRVNNYAEIGTSGTYINALKTYYPIEQAIVINEAPSWLDFIHGRSWNPLQKFKAYNKFASLNNYEPILEKEIASNSIDLVTCVIGLHHIPQDKIKPFLQSIYRILKPGGRFVLREHDAKDESTKATIQMAHTVYNIVSAEVEVEKEIKEYRNFQSLDYWVKAVQKIGFTDQGKRLYQQGDPTLNAIIVFVKPPQSLAEREAELEENSTYKRDLTNTLLTMPEWHNVLTSSEYARFIHHTPFYEFPYLASIASFWDVFSKSWQQARKYQSFWQVLGSEYTQMNLFIGAFMTVEYAWKALISAPIRFFFSGQEPGYLQLLIRDPYDEIKVICSEARVLKDFDLEDIKLVEVPRYKKFQEVIQSLKPEHKIEVISISGQKKIQFTLKHNLDDIQFEGAEKLYDWDFPTLPNTKFTAVMVETKNLKEFMAFLFKQKIEIFYIHDF